MKTSAGDHPSVNRQRCTDDVGCLVRRNKDDGIGDSFRSADSLARNVCGDEVCFFFLRLRRAVEHSRFPRTRTNDVDANACAGEFDRLPTLAKSGRIGAVWTLPGCTLNRAGERRTFS